MVTARRNRLSPRLLALAILGLGLLACLGLNLPGQLSYDSVAQLHDGHFGIYNGWHPPVMAFLLGIADAIVPGTGLFVAFDAALFFASAALLLGMERQPRWTAPAATALLVLMPQVLLYQGIVWKDVLYADSAIAGFVSIAFAAARWESRGLRFGGLSAGLILLVLGALARQNGAIALAFGIAAIGTLAAAKAKGRAVRALALYAVTALVAALVLDTAASVALDLRTPGGSAAQAQFRLLAFYDLIGAIKDRPDLKLDRLARTNPDLVDLMRDDGVRLYTPERNDTLVQSPALQSELADTPAAVMLAQWQDLIIHHPLAYLKLRGRVFGWVFLTPRLDRCFPVYVGVSGPPNYMQDLHLTARVRPQDNWLKAYATRFVGSPAYSHLAFALLALGELAFLLRRRSPTDLVMALLLASALAFVASFFVIAIACDYRYLLFLDLSALVGGLYLAATRPQKRPKAGAGLASNAKPHEFGYPGVVKRLHQSAKMSEDRNGRERPA